MFPKLRLFGEVQQGLAPVLEQLGLTARIREWMGHPTIHFETPDGTMRSPIRLVVKTEKPIKRAGSRWKGHIVQYTGFDERPLPGSDWIYVRFGALDNTYLRGSDEESLMLLARELMDHNLTFTDEHPKVTYDEDFFKAYNGLTRTLKKFGDLTVECRRSGEVESQHFTDHVGRSWQLEFDHRVNVLIDGTRVKEFTYQEVQAIVPFIKRDLAKVALELDDSVKGMRL